MRNAYDGLGQWSNLYTDDPYSIDGFRYEYQKTDNAYVLKVNFIFVILNTIIKFRTYEINSIADKK